YVLPLHHPLRLIEEISMLDNLSDGRLEIGVGRGGVMEAFFWGQEADPETNYARYLETLAIIREGLSHDELTYAGRFHSFDKLPMYLRPLQKPYPPLWYMRNPVTAAMEGMHTIIVGSLDGLAVAVPRYRAAWEEHQGSGTRTVQGDEPMIGLVVHLVIADTDEEARAVVEYMDEYLATGANYFVCSFQWGDLSHAQAMRSIDLFASEVMPKYQTLAGQPADLKR